MSDRTHLARGRRALISMRRPENASNTLACFHFAGGSAQSYHRWRDVVPASTELVALETPGRGRRFDEPFAKSITSIADELATVLMSAPPRDQVFYGHSMGGVLAFETALVIKRRGGTLPNKLIISACPAPNSRVGYADKPDLSDASLTAYVTRLNSVPRLVRESPAQMQLALSVLRADLEILNAYRWTQAEALPIPIEVIGGLDDDSVAFELLASWQNLTTRDFRLTVIDGGHFATIENPSLVMERLMCAADVL